MKNFKIMMTVLLVTLLFSCSSNDDEETPAVYEEQNFLSGFLEKAEFDQSNLMFTGYPLYFGFSFTPLVEGKINSFVIELPLNDEFAEIILWDKTSESVVYTKEINVIGNEELIVEIDPIYLVKDKEYVLSVYSMSSLFRKNSADQDANFPIVEGDIKINHSAFDDDPSVMPDSVEYGLYFGDVSFNFQRTK